MQRKIPKAAKNLADRLMYDPTTGVILWVDCANKNFNGKIAGSINKRGYRRITFDYLDFPASAIIWFKMTGHFPTKDEEVDHRNRVRDDDSWNNLKLTTSSGNNHNRRIKKSGRSLPSGVEETQHGRYRARISVRGKSISLGTYATAYQASEIYERYKNDEQR